jgi:hypothetical protein
MMLRTMGILFSILLLGASSPDPWAPVRGLEGRWSGEGQG